MTETQPRTVVGGRVEGDVFVIVLDGDQEVETTDEQIAKAAAKSRSPRRHVAVDLEPSNYGRRPRVLELQILSAPEAQTAASTQAVATRQAAPMAAAAPPMPHGLISNPEQLTAQLQAMSQHYNVLSPAIAVSQFAEGFGANLSVVRIDPTITEWDDKNNGLGPETYCSASIHRSRDKRSINRSGLQKIEQSLGIQWDHRFCQRMDDGRERNFWRWKHVGYLRTHDGQLQTVEGSRELDLRDGAAAVGGMSTSMLKQQRSMGNQLCETMSKLRAIRNFVRASYTVEELKKPFLVVRISFTPDMNDPEIKKLVTQNAMAGIGALYPHQPAAVLPALPPADDIDETLTSDAPAEKAPRQMGQSTAAKADPFASAPAEDELPIGQALIAKVEPRHGKNKQTGKPWALYKVTLSNGEVATTFSESLQKLIDEAVEKKLPVQYTTEPSDGDYDDKLVTLTIVDTRQGSLPMGGEKY